MSVSEAIIVSATEANRSFSKLFRAVAQGAQVTITSRGRPIAKMIPMDDRADKEQLRQAFGKLLGRLERTEFSVVGPWSREELYERDKAGS